MCVCLDVRMCVCLCVGIGHLCQAAGSAEEAEGEDHWHWGKDHCHWAPDEDNVHTGLHGSGHGQNYKGTYVCEWRYIRICVWSVDVNTYICTHALFLSLKGPVEKVTVCACVGVSVDLFQLEVHTYLHIYLLFLAPCNSVLWCGCCRPCTQ